MSKIITISRQFGSLGRSIAEELSKELGILYLDRDIVEETAKRMGLAVSMISSEEERSKPRYLMRQYPLGMGMLSIQDEIFSVQSNIIRDIAEKDSCIIVGRCADYILRDHKNILNVYVYAPYEARLHNCIHVLGMDEKTAKRMIRDVDKARENYWKRYCPEEKDHLELKHILLNSSKFSIPSCAKILANAVNEIG